MAVNVGVFAADYTTVEQIEELLTGAGHHVSGRETVEDREADANAQLAEWIFAPAPMDLVIGIATHSTRAALAWLTPQRLLGFSDDVDVGWCEATLVVLVPAAAALEKLLPRVDTELARKPPPKTVSIPAKTTAAPETKVTIPAAAPVKPSARAAPSPVKPPAIPSPLKFALPDLSRSLPSVVVSQGSRPAKVKADAAKVATPLKSPPPREPVVEPAAVIVEDSMMATTREAPPKPTSGAISKPAPKPRKAEEDAGVVIDKSLLLDEPPTARAKPPKSVATPPAFPKMPTTEAPSLPKPATPALEAKTPPPAKPKPIDDSMSIATPMFDSVSSFGESVGPAELTLRSKPNKRVWFAVVGVAALAAGSVGVYMVTRAPTTSGSRVSETTGAAKQHEATKPPPEETAATPDAEADPPFIEIDEPQGKITDPTTTEPTTTEPTTTTPTKSSTTTGTTTTGTTTPTKPTATSAKPTATSTTAAGTTSTPTTSTGTTPTKPGTAATTTTPPTQPVTTAPSDGCDQASCVLDYYARPCCERYKPREKGALPYELERGGIPAAMSKVKAAVIRCGEQHPTPGVVKLAIEVGGDGKIKDITVSETPDPALGECVATAARKATFAESQEGGSFTYPFKF